MAYVPTRFDRSLEVLKLSTMAPKIEMVGHDGAVVANATGAFFEHLGSIFLVSNWHNFAGLNPISGKYLTRAADIPFSIRVKGRKNSDNSQASLLEFELPLTADDGSGPVWLEHPFYKRTVDVAAIKIPFEHQDGIFVCNQDIEPYPVKKFVGDEVFVVGYPKNIDAGPNLPLWKRASIASEPAVDIDDLPKYYIDTASRKGMSGSPVIFRSHSYLTDDEKLAVGKTAILFYGIYSGRIGEIDDDPNDPISAQIGIVWKPAAVWEIVALGCRAVI